MNQTCHWWIYCLLPLPVLAGFTAGRIRLQAYCTTLMILILILQNWKQMDKFHDPFRANILFLWIYRQLLQLNNVLTKNKQTFYSKLKYITIPGYVKLKTLHQPCYCKIMKHNVSWIIHPVKNCTKDVKSTTTNFTSPNSLQCIKKTIRKVVFCNKISENLYNCSMHYCNCLQP